VAWITGAGRGIGRAAAQALADQGVHVGLTARTESELKEVAAACEERGVKAKVAAADVTDEYRVAHAWESIEKELGPPGILVNAAGNARSEAFLKTDAALMEEHWRLNLLGTFHATRTALPAMLEAGWGRVVNVASVAGKAGAKYITAYAASKHAVLGLTRCLAVEFADKGVTVNAVCPGYVDTDMTDKNVTRIVEKTGLDREEALARIRRMSPQNRMMSPAEVAATIVHLCGEDAMGINGQAITIDGGALPW
jgi:NAD(P)-dependent dehydrogenase (short-subunit alcohol dehydrogenase family)